MLTSLKKHRILEACGIQSKNHLLTRKNITKWNTLSWEGEWTLV